MDTINQVQNANNSAEYWAKQAEALERLYENDDFKTVILEGYFKDRAVAGTSILAVDQIKHAGKRPDVMEGLIAISALQDHFNTIRMLGSTPEENYEDNEEAGEFISPSELAGD